MITRRKLLVGSAAAATLPFTSQIATAQDDWSFDPSSPLPHKEAFFPFEGTYLNSASQHPMCRVAKAAADRYLEYKNNY